MNESLIYFIQGERNGLIKIGLTTGDPNQRLRALQCGSAETLRILGVMRGTRAVEAAMHRQFVSTRVHGEWFESSPELLTFIAEHTADSEPVTVESGRRTHRQTGAGMRLPQMVVPDDGRYFDALAQRIETLIEVHCCARCKKRPPIPDSRYCLDCSVCFVHHDDRDEDGECEWCQRVELFERLRNGYRTGEDCQSLLTVDGPDDGFDTCCANCHKEITDWSTACLIDDDYVLHAECVPPDDDEPPEEYEDYVAAQVST